MADAMKLWARFPLGRGRYFDILTTDGVDPPREGLERIEQFVEQVLKPLARFNEESAAMSVAWAVQACCPQPADARPARG